ncbi:MAG: Stp1/IreP family PP2C-type Ser/Thr phosphatase [Anaerolineae bacterium]|nr:Stp1/IreP family PP2C-type Ser/Thr phosphatase [Anaerolineae bacterium]
MKCPNCGYENRESAHFCHRCGAALTAQSPAGPGVSRQRTKPLARSDQVEAGSPRPLPDTRPLAEASVAFAPLPEGALLNNGRYVVVEVRAINERLNGYLVEDSTPVRLCPSCQAEATDPEERFCSFCGADLSGVEPLHLRYLIQESADGQAFAMEAQLLRMRLEHPGLLLPCGVFAEAPYGLPRHYLIEPEFSPPLATTLPVPQPLHQVLGWGVSLAQALDYLHRHQVTLHGGGATPSLLSHIAVERKTARWAHLHTAYVIPPAARSKASKGGAIPSQDVRGLAAALFYLATGQPQYTPHVTLPEPVAGLFALALGSPQGFIDAATFGATLETALQEVRRPTSVTLVVGRRTDVGQERSLNEDSLLTLDTAPVFRSISAPVGLFIVADGMGGHEAGDVASQLTIRTIAQLAISEALAPAAAGKPLPEAGEWLTAATQAANRTVYEQRRAAGTDMGTTLVMALFVGDTAAIANVGDSRAYLLKQDGIVQISTDHSLVQRLVATGQITPEEAASHPQKNVIYRVIGDKPRTEPDLFEQRLAPGEALLLCSDGLSGMVPDEKIWHIWKTSTSPQDGCDRLVEAANRAGGEDNVTVVIVQVSH